MEDLWDNAIKEAYNVSTVAILSTLELYHSSWNEQPSYIVNDNEDLSGMIEAGADFNSGTVVTFSKCAFSLNLPESSDRLPEMEITIDNVSAELMPHVLSAIGVRSPIYVVYREYLKEDSETTPHYVLRGLYLNAISCSDSTVVGTAVFGDYNNRSFPNKVFELKNFPGLKRS